MLIWCVSAQLFFKCLLILLPDVSWLPKSNDYILIILRTAATLHGGFRKPLSLSHMSILQVCFLSCSPRIQSRPTSALAISALAMYAISGKSIRVTLCVVLLGSINPCVNMVRTSTLCWRSLADLGKQFYETTLTFEASPPPFFGCSQLTTLSYPSADLLL